MNSKKLSIDRVTSQVYHLTFDIFVVIQCRSIDTWDEYTGRNDSGIEELRNETISQYNMLIPYSMILHTYIFELYLI